MSNLYYLDGDVANAVEELYYEKEDILQKIVADNPQLVARSESEDLALIKREWAIGDSTTFSLDALMIDMRTAVPVLVEVKRSCDTRINREVIGQMADYACRTGLWDIDEIRECYKQNNPNDLFNRYENAHFWKIVEMNLKSIHFRLAYVADNIPERLRTLLNFTQQAYIDSIEVYGIELHLHKVSEIINGKLADGSDKYMISKQVLNYAKQRKQSDVDRIGQKWDMEQFYEQIKTALGTSQADITYDLLTRLDEMQYTTVFGTAGTKHPRVSIKLDNKKLFEISPLSKAVDVHIYIKQICELLGDAYSKERVIEMFGDWPDKDVKAAYGPTDSGDYYKIEAPMLSTPANMTYFIAKVQNLYNLLKTE